MKKTIKVSMVGDYVGEAMKYLKATGLNFPLYANGDEDATLFIEMKELPEIISALIYSGYHSNEIESKVEWMLHRFTEKGATLFVYAFDNELQQEYERFILDLLRN